MSSFASILDIPHVVSSIGSYLDRPDQVACTLVNKTFYELFNPILWRQFILDRPSSFVEDDRLELHQKQALIRNCQWIRSLTIRASSDKSTPAFITTSCTRLKDLSIHIISDFDDISVSDFITNNKGLETFSLTTYAHPTYANLEQLASVLSTSIHLTVMKLEFRWRPRRGWLKHVLQHLPRKLQKLTLQWRRMYKLDDSGQSFSTHPWPEIYPALEVVDMAFDSGEGDEVVLGQFLERCPSLQSLRYPTMAEAQIKPLIPLLGASNLPHLSSLYLGRFRKTNELQWQELVMAMKGRIKHFSTSSEFYSPLTNIVPTVARNWSETLESLRFLCFSHIFARDVQLILTTCSRLKHFDCMWTLSQPSMMTDDTLGSSSTDWVCLGLEELHLMFPDHRTVQADENITEQQELWTVGWIEQAYKQLGRLTELHTLAIGWRSTHAFSQKSNLDMTLKGGLGHMGKMKALRTLDINFLPRVHAGISEVQWMKENWPSLSVVSGFGYRRQVPTKDEPEHITWVRANWPELTIY